MHRGELHSLPGALSDAGIAVTILSLSVNPLPHHSYQAECFLFYCIVKTLLLHLDGGE